MNIEKKNLWKELSVILGFTPRLDGLLTALDGEIHIDIIHLDKALGNRLSDYDSESCLYKGKPASMQDVVTAEYGERAGELVSLLF